MVKKKKVSKRSPAKKKLVKNKAAPKAVSTKKTPLKEEAAEPSPKDRKYKKSFLTQVIARIDFAAPIPLSPHGPPKQVITSLRKNFPIPDPQKTTRRRLTVVKNEIQDTTHEVTEWVYHGRSREKLLRITDQCMFIEYTKYTVSGR